MPLLAFAVGQPAKSEQIRTAEQPYPVVVLEPSPGVEPVGDVEEPMGGEASVHGVGV